MGGKRADMILMARLEVFRWDCYQILRVRFRQRPIVGYWCRSKVDSKDWKANISSRLRISD